MRGIAGDERQFAVFRGTQYGKVGRFNYFAGPDDVMEKPSASKNVNIVAITKSVHVPEKGVAMTGNNCITQSPGYGGFGEMCRSQQERMAGCSLQNDIFQVDSWNGQL